jgi:DNA-binding GntR family transcriptional regulator
MSGAAPRQRIVSDTLPRYASLAATLAEEIAGGRPPVGALLPPEQELVARFGVSRATVREALRRLRAMGLVAAMHGVGTRVVASHPPPAYEMAVRSLADLMGYAQPTVLVVERRETLRVDAALADMLGIAPGMEVLRLSGLRRAQDEEAPVLSAVQMFLPAAFAAMAERAELGRVPVYRLIERELGIPVVDMDQDIAAVPLGAAEARRLGVARGTPGLRIVRRFRGPGGRLLEATVNLHAAASRFTYRIRLSSPSAGG